MTNDNAPKFNPMLKSYAEQGVKYLASISKELQVKIEGSKTSVKKKYYLKKLKKNNLELADMLMRLEYLTKHMTPTETPEEESEDDTSPTV